DRSSYPKRGQAPLCVAPCGPFRQRCLTPFRIGTLAREPIAAPFRPTSDPFQHTGTTSDIIGFRHGWKRGPAPLPERPVGCCAQRCLTPFPTMPVSATGLPLTTSPSIAVLIPALNEEASLPLVLRDIPRQLVNDIIVVDNGSQDRTAEVARESGARVVHEPERGYGAACLRGLADLAQRPDGPPEIVVFLDGDYSD